MSDFYDDMADLAADLLNEFGRPATLTHSGGAASSVAKRAGRAVTPSEIDAEDILTVVKPMKVADDEGRMLLKTVAVLLVQANVGDTIAQGQLTYRVTNVNPVAPVGQPIVYFAEVE